MVTVSGSENANQYMANRKKSFFSPSLPQPAPGVYIRGIPPVSLCIFHRYLYVSCLYLTAYPRYPVLYPCLDLYLYLAMLQQIQCISRCIPHVSIHTFLAVPSCICCIFRCTSPHLTVSKTGFDQKYTPEEGSLSRPKNKKQSDPLQQRIGRVHMPALCSICISIHQPPTPNAVPRIHPPPYAGALAWRRGPVARARAFAGAAE